MYKKFFFNLVVSISLSAVAVVALATVGVVRVLAAVVFKHVK